MPARREEEDGERRTVLLALRALRWLSVPGGRADVRNVSVRHEAHGEPHCLHAHTHHQAGLALALGCRAHVPGHPGHRSHSVRSDRFCALQRHAHRAGVRARAELRAADGHLPDLPHHVPDDRRAEHGGVRFTQAAARPRDVHHLLGHADQNQPHLPYFRTGQEVGDGAEVHQPYIAARHHLHPRLLPGETKLVAVQRSGDSSIMFGHVRK